MRDPLETVPAASSTVRWSGRVLQTLALLFFALDGTLHLLAPTPVATAFVHLGYGLDRSAIIGTLEWVCLLMYALPATALVGAVLLTAILGGAVAAHLRVQDAAFETVVFPILIGVLVWAPLCLRDPPLRSRWLPGAR